MMRENKGVTLIEIVVAVALIAAVGIPLSRLFTDSFRFQARSQAKTEVNKVLQYVAEQFKSGNYLGLVDGDGYFSLNEGNSGDIVIGKDEIKGITGNYNVHVEFVRGEELESGISMPLTYDAELEVGTSQEVNGNLTMTYNKSTNIISLTSAENADESFAILITNIDESIKEISVNKEIENTVTFYKKFDEGEEFTLVGASDDVYKPSIIREFKQSPWHDPTLGESVNRKLKVVNISAVKENDDTIFASMEATFTADFKPEE